MHHACGINVKFDVGFRFRENFCEIFGFRETKFRQISIKLPHFPMLFAFSRILRNEIFKVLEMYFTCLTEQEGRTIVPEKCKEVSMVNFFFVYTMFTLTS
jgi:hypothetical protein